jgi:hypothetical protein
MTVIALNKRSKFYKGETKTEVKQLIRAAKKDIRNYDLVYIYEGMSRKPYSSGYQEAHRRAALAYYYRNKSTGRPRGRPLKED